MVSLFMCEPTYFSLSTQINPWMGSQGSLDLQKALAQWTHAKQCLEEAGAKITRIPGQPGLQDMTFCADAGIVQDKKILLANYKYSARKPETQHFRQWFAQNGYEVCTTSELYSKSLSFCSKVKDFGIYKSPLNSRNFRTFSIFEGGDVVRTDNTVVCGTGIRSSGSITTIVKQAFSSLKVIGPLELANPWFYHLDTAFTLLNKDTALYYPDAFSQQTQTSIPQLFPKAIAVSKTDAFSFALNLVKVNKTIFLNTCSQELKQIIESFGYSVVKLGLTEFLKSGGSIKCLTLQLA